MGKKIALLIMLAAAASGQQTVQQINLQYVAPPPVQGLQANVVGTAGTTLNCYWVVVNYAGGGVLSSPACLSNVPNSLSSTNYVSINWQAAAGVNVTYDVLKTTSTTPPVAGASSSLTTGLTVTNTTDQGGSLSAYTISAYPYATGTVLLRVNNRDYAYPAIECVGTTTNICRAADDFLIPKASGPSTVRLGSQTSPFTIDGTGAPYITQGSATPGAPVGTTVAGVPLSVSATLTLAQVNAGTIILPAVTGQTYKVSHFLMTATGSTATCTSINISDTAGTPVNAAAVAAASLTTGTPVDETISGVTLTAFAPTALTAGQGIQIRHIGSACTTTTSLTVTVYFTINS